MRLILQFEKTGSARFISHLDVLRALQRALRRAQIPVSYSNGFNPHMLLSFATALSLGAQSTAELLDLRTDRDISPQELVQKLNAVLPAGLRAVRAREAAREEPALTKTMRFAAYTVCCAPCQAQIAAFLESAQVLVTKRSKKGPRQVDIRPMVRTLFWDDGAQCAKMVLECCESNALQPELLLGAMQIPGRAKVTRTALYGERDGALTDLFDGGAL